LRFVSNSILIRHKNYFGPWHEARIAETPTPEARYEVVRYENLAPHRLGDGPYDGGCTHSETSVNVFQNTRRKIPEGKSYSK
jgi:hypothetical protein